MSLPARQEQSAPAHVSTGAGIAIAFIWLGGIAITIFVLWFVFIYDPLTAEDVAYIVQQLIYIQMGFGLLFILPMIASFAAMRMILGKRN